MASSKGDLMTFIVLFVGAIIAIVMLSASADQVSLQTSTIIITNSTVTGPAVNSTLDLTGRELLTTVEIYNATNVSQSLRGVGGVALQSGSTSGGVLTVQLLINDTSSNFASQSINISYTANPNGFLPTAADRSIMNLVIIFGALAALVFVIVMLFQSESMKELLKR